MSQNSRAVTYTLRANTSGVPGLERFQQSLQNIVKVQEQIKRQGDVLAGLRDRTATVRLKFETAALEREMKRIDGREIKLKIGLTNLDGARNDINTLRALLTSVGSNMQYRVTVNTTALSGIHAQINTQIVQLQSLISQLRSLGGAGGAGGRGGAGGPGAGSGLSAAALDAIRNVERLNNLWTRNQISAQNYSQALQAMQTRLQEAARTAGVGTAEYARIDAAITRITQSLRGINTDSLNKIRTDAAAMRAAFDQATAGVSRNSVQFRQALQAYEQASAGLQTRLSGIASAGNLTTQQLGQINREVARLARELNTIQGGINHAGLSGSINNVAAGAMPILQQSGGALGMAAMNGAALVNTFRSIQQSSGTAGLALGGVGLAAAGVAATFVNLGSTGLDEMKKVEKGMNILQANGVRDLKAVEAQVASLQESLGAVGGAFTKGDLTLAMADIIKAGVSADDALKLMASSTRLAAAEQINLNDASGLLLKNLRQYGLGMDDAAKAGDMLAKAGNLAAGTAFDLSTGLGIVGGTGKQAKIELYDLLGMLIELDNKGMSAADVGANGLRAAIAALADITEKGKGVLAGLNIELVDSAGYARPAGDIMKDLGEKMRGMGITVDKATGTLSGNGEALKTVASIMDNRAAAAIINLTGDWKDYGQQVRDSNGELVNYSTTMQQGVEPAIKSLQNAWRDTGAEFAKSFAKPLADFLNNTLTPTVKKLGEMFELFKDPPKFQATLKVDWANDSATMIAFKMLASGAGGFKTGLDKMAAGGQRDWDNIVSYFKGSELQGELQKAKLIETPSSIGGARAQLTMIEGNMAKYQTMLAEHLKANTAASERLGKALNGNTAAMQPLKGQGPLLPGQLRAGNQPFGSNFATLNPSFQKALGDVLSQYVAKNAGGLQPFINEGARTMERQAALYAQGRTTPGNIVTNAKPGQSLHNYGVAADIYWRDPKTGKIVSFTDPRALEAAKALGQLANKNGLLWGGTPGRGFPVDMPHVQYDISWQQAQREYRPATAATQGGAAANTSAPNEKLKKTLEEAHRLIKQYGMAVASGNEVWISKATAAVKTFKQANKDAWTKDLDAEFKAAGKGVAAAANVTAAQITRAMELQGKVDAAQKAAQAKPNDQGLKVAYAAATAELKKWTDASEANAAALAAVNSTQEKAARSAGQYIATQKDLKTYGNDALKLYKALETAQKSGSAAAVTTAERNIAAWMGESQAKKAVFEAESAAYKVRQANTDKATADETTRAKNRLQTQQNLQKALAEGREADARAALDNLKRSQAAELALAQNSAAKRAEIIRQTGPAIIAAEDRLANLRRDRAVKEAQRVADEALKLPGADPKAIEATRVEAVRQAYRTAAADRARVRAEQEAAQQGANQAALQAQQQHERERKRLMAQAAAEARALRYADAEATLKRIQDNNKAELDAFKGTAQAKLALIRAQTQAEFDAAEVVARIRRDNALRENANKYAGREKDPNKLEADRQIRQAYTDTVSGLRDARASAVRVAQQAVQDEAARGAAELAAQDEASYEERRQWVIENIKAFGKDGLISLYSEARATRDGQLMAAVMTEFDRRTRDAVQEAESLWADLYDKALQAGEDPEDRTSGLDNRDAFKPAGQSLAALIGDPQSFVETWKALGMTDTLPELFEKSFTADQFAGLGVPVLQGLITGLGDSPQWAKVTEVMRAGLEQALDVAGLVAERDATLGTPTGTETGNERPGDPSSRGDNAPDSLASKEAQRVALDDYTRSLANMTDAQLEAERAANVAAEREAHLNAVLAVQRERADANAAALQRMADALNAPDGDDQRLQGWSDRLTQLTADLENGVITQEDFNEQARSGAASLDLLAASAERRAAALDPQQDAEQIARLTALAALYRQSAADLQLLTTATVQYNAETSKSDTRLEEWNRRLTDLVEGYESGAISQEDFTAQAVAMLPELDRLALKADDGTEAGKALAEVYRAAAKALREAGGGAVGAAEGMDKLVGTAKKIAQAFSQVGAIFDRFRTDGEKGPISILGDWMTMNVTAAEQWIKGDYVGAIVTTVNGILDIGESIANLDPGFKQWKKNLSEVAALEKQLMGAKTIGGAYGMNGWDNPYHDALSKDAANREALAGSKWYQRLAWDLFGGRPEVMKDDLAKTMSTAAAIFNDFGQSVYSTMESALMDAIDKGDFSDVGKNISKSLNTFVQRMYVQTVISKSRLKDLVKQLADEQPAGKDTSGTRAAIEAEMRSVAATVEAGAVSLPGFGEGAATGDTSASAPATSPQVGANFYVANSSKIDLFDNAVQRADAMYLRHEAVLTRHGDVLTRHADVLERVLRDGIPLIDTQGNYRGALR
ncbi:phage tail tape measure protein [Deinococcus taklimakanensis]|uniref:Phage tail tape measure protein n=1 Tax=Deinococcus taklimakanensis TaxID=536443 RepID=A0ABW5P374_9DEIO